MIKRAVTSISLRNFFLCPHKACALVRSTLLHLFYKDTNPVGSGPHPHDLLGSYFFLKGQGEREQPEEDTDILLLTFCIL